MSEGLASVLYNRGIRGERQILSYLNPSSNDFHNPFLFKDMKKAVSIIKECIEKKEKILIYGDYDCDGVSSLSILYKYLISIGGIVSRVVPDRIRDGYGLNMSYAQSIVNKGFNLVITVDNGITAIEEVEYLRANGVKVIVTDHHEPGESIPECDALLDAKVPDESYPFKELCGAGVVLKIIEAMSNKSTMVSYLDIAALATVADVVPLVDENRTIVKLGLERINKNAPLWVKSLRRVCPNLEEITSTSIGFTIAPMINAMGRIDSAKKAVEFLCEEDETESLYLAGLMKSTNDKRKQMSNEIINTAKINTNHNILLAAGKWHIGIVGLVAARFARKYNKPTIVFGYNAKTNLFTGSGRSVGDFNLFEALSPLKNLTKKFGGHKGAIGITIKEENIKLFAQAAYNIFDEIDPTMFSEKIYYDLEYSVNDMMTDTIPDVGLIEPSGEGNRIPCAAIKNVEFNDIRAMSGGAHYLGIVSDSSADNGFKALVFNSPIAIRSGQKYNIILPIISDGDHIADYIEEASSDEPPHCCSKVDVSNGGSQKGANGVSFVDTSKRIEPRIPDKNYACRIISQSLDTLQIAPKKKEQFEKAGIFTVSDLLDYFPKKYYDFRRTVTTEGIRNDELCAVIGVVDKIRSTVSSKGGSILSCTCIDTKGVKFTARWFNQGYVERMIQPDATYIFCGTGYVGEVGYPSINVLYFGRNISKLQTLIPVYKKIKGMSNEYLNESINKALDNLPLTDYLEKKIVDDFNVVDRPTAYALLHRPRNLEDITMGQTRKVFDQLFEFSLRLNYAQKSYIGNNGFPIGVSDITNKLDTLLPYELTNGQRLTIESIIDEMKEPDKTVNALIQGDVGCGKTMIAYYLAAVSVQNGFQVCITAPTEILARQHYAGFAQYGEKLGIKANVLTSATRGKERKDVLESLVDGECSILFGTHAVLGNEVHFKNLGMVIIDEQHKFGVEQRDSFIKNGSVPHMITMSATPIPRTLAMTIYGGSISVYNITDKPGGRQDIITKKMASLSELNAFILSEVRKGNQAYIVCPIIDDSDSEKMKDVKSVKSMVELEKKFFENYPEIKVSDISGRMKKDLVAEEISKFRENRTNVLISTTVVEVGVDVPNATVIALMSSDRFGLAQAHQLRGRVGRGVKQSYCLLCPDDPNDQKADILCNNNNGFDIAKEDLAMRGTGDFIGKSQSGNNKDVMLMISEPEFYEKISSATKKIVQDPTKMANYSYLLERDAAKE